MTPEEVRHFRARLDLTQAALADALGIEVRTVQRWEAGATEPAGFLALALAELERRIISRPAG